MELDPSTFFCESVVRICSSLNVDIALKRFSVYLKKFVPHLGMDLGLYDDHMNVYRILASIWPPQLKKMPKLIPFPKELRDDLRLIWRRKQDITIINDPEETQPLYQKILPMFWRSGPMSCLLTDLELEGKRLGNLILWAEGKHRFSESHARLMSSLNEPFAMAVSNILQHQEILQLRDRLIDDNRDLRRQLLEISGDTIIGENFGLKKVVDTVRQVATLDSPILLMGETGVGKDVIANAIHYGSRRSKNPFVKVNCGAIPETLIDSELFGHEKGAFTGALSKKLGRFERAHTGTIFLDEIGDLPLAAQNRLLRVLEQYEIERVGGTETIPVDVRIISATHKNLQEMVRSGQFREDLWFRLNVFPILIPPLRERLQDIPLLVHHFIERKLQKLRIPEPPALAPGSLEYLQSYHWPGNVRELENIVERALIQSQLQNNDKFLRFEKLLDTSSTRSDRSDELQTDLLVTWDKMKADYIQKVLVRTDGKVKGKGGAAEILGINPSTLRAKMKKLGIPYGRKCRVYGRGPDQAGLVNTK